MLRDACQNWGLFVLINHGIPDDAITTVFAAAQQFMALPLEEKLKVVVAVGILQLQGLCAAAGEVSYVDRSPHTLPTDQTQPHQCTWLFQR